MSVNKAGRRYENIGELVEQFCQDRLHADAVYRHCVKRVDPRPSKESAFTVRRHKDDWQLLTPTTVIPVDFALSQSYDMSSTVGK